MKLFLCSLLLASAAGEQNDLSQAKPELVAKLRAELDAWQKATQAPIPSTLNPEYIGPAQ